MARGSLIVISGFSGVGKGTVVNSLISRYEGYALSISATTRAPRGSEQHGKEYYFLTDEQFSELIRLDGLIEYAAFCDHYYGTPKQFVEEKLAEGKNVLLEIEVEGAKKIRSRFPDTPLIFIIPPSAEALKKRLVGRGSDEPEAIRNRLARAVREADSVGSYDYVFVNEEGKVDECADAIHALICSLEHAAEKNAELTDRICREIHTFSDEL